MAETDISVCSNALALIGQDPINQLNDEIGTATSITCAQLYPPLKLALLAMHPWHFTKSRAKLSKEATGPISEWANSFLLPSPRLLAPNAVYRSAADDVPFKRFEIVGDKIECDEDELWIEYQVDRSEAFWPPEFLEFVTIAMAAKLAVPVTQQRSLARDLKIEAFGLPREDGRGGWFRKAARADARRSPSKALIQGAGILIEARLG